MYVMFGVKIILDMKVTVMHISIVLKRHLKKSETWINSLTIAINFISTRGSGFICDWSHYMVSFKNLFLPFITE